MILEKMRSSVKIGARVLDLRLRYALWAQVAQMYVVFRPQAPRSINFSDFMILLDSSHNSSQFLRSCF